MSDEIFIDDEDGPPAERPDAVRVGRRALALYAVATRASFEREESAEAGERYRESLLDWVAQHQLDGEFEAHERAFINAAVGTPEQRAMISASWRTEGAAVLAWALGRFELPALDQSVSLSAIGDVLYDGLPLSELRLRDARHITEFESVLYNLHWRVCHYRRDPAPYDLRRMLHDENWPPPDVAPLPYGDDDDMLIGGQPFTAASADDRATCTSIVWERRRAATWLCGDDPDYSRVSMDT